MNNNNRFRLEIGNNWWSRFLILSFWTVGIYVLLDAIYGCTSGDTFTTLGCSNPTLILEDYVLMHGFGRAVVVLVVLFILWKTAQWVVNGSTLKTVKEKDKPNRPQQILIGVALVLFLLATASMFFA